MSSVRVVRRLILLTVTASSFSVLPLTEGALSLEYMSTGYVGSPPQRFVVQVDISNGQLAINCQGGSNCKSHLTPLFDLALSSSAAPLTCVIHTSCIFLLEEAIEKLGKQQKGPR
jgi:hypothetical protein